MTRYENTKELADEEVEYLYPDLSGQTEESNGVVHYYDEEGFEVETFVPGWGC